jgi:glucose/mannose-6-phosphate isomerase
MNLDDLELFRKIDTGDMLRHIMTLPDQVEKAWKLGQQLPLGDAANFRHIIIAGMGGSAIGADMLAAFAAPICRLPIVVHRDYNLPAWASGRETLVILSSHSGDTEETISSFEAALKNQCSVLAITRGGRIGKLAKESDSLQWNFVHDGQPRSAVGFNFMLPLAFLCRKGLLPDPAQDVAAAVRLMRQQAEFLAPSSPVVKNPAKRMAGQLMNRWVTVVGAGYLAPISRRWKGQINEIAKAWAQFEFLPEIDHNTLAGIINPENLLQQMMALFLQSSCDHPRNQQRNELTKQAFMLEGLNTDFFIAPGETPMEQIWLTLHFGDFLAYYLAMAYQVDPTPIPAIQGFKSKMK